MPFAPRDWADPFLDQAREDLKAAWAVSQSRESASTLCMLLQMVFEKLAKAAHARSGNMLPRNHRATSHLFALLLRHPAGVNLLRASSNVRQFVAELETAHPAEARKQQQPWPQLEYPWEDAVAGLIRWPAHDLPLARRVRDPRDRIALDCLRFASALVKQLPTIVP
ncbi:MAG: hypothetical protein WCN95_02640 [bacterium]